MQKYVQSTKNLTLYTELSYGQLHNTRQHEYAWTIVRSLRWSTNMAA